MSIILSNSVFSQINITALPLIIYNDSDREFSSDRPAKFFHKKKSQTGSFLELSHFKFKLFTGQYMKMQMENGLTGVRAAI